MKLSSYYLITCANCKLKYNLSNCYHHSLSCSEVPRLKSKSGFDSSQITDICEQNLNLMDLTMKDAHVDKKTRIANHDMSIVGRHVASTSPVSSQVTQCAAKCEHIQVACASVKTILQCDATDVLSCDFFRLLSLTYFLF